MPASCTLCDHCRLLFSHASFNAIDEEQNVIEEYLRIDTLPGLPNLQKEAARDCSVCAELRKCILAQGWSDDVREITIGPATLIHESQWESDLTPEQEGVWMIDFAVNLSESNSFTLHFDLYAHPGSYANTQLRVRRSPPFSDRRSSKCIDLLQGWISKCVDSHWQCESRDEDFWPTRVIDVGPGDGTIDPKLITTSGEASKYVALSHCWGKPGPGVRSLRTLASTVDSHEQGIPLTSMPCNYQDAVIVTRALGLRYLWIDSLCIHQDSAEDWAKEGSQMDEIYKCAWVTLAATSASTSEDGFLGYLLKDRMFPIQVPHSHDPPPGHDDSLQSESHQIFARSMETRDSYRFEADVDGSTWNSRGWTLQERHLARRIVHFSRSQVFWECRRGIESECGHRIIQLPFSITPAYGPEDSPSEYSSDSESLQSETEQILGSNDNTSESSESDRDSIQKHEITAARMRLYSWWFQVLGDYSRRKLTYASDKLHAISGIAKELNTMHLEISQSEDQYMVGLWLGALADCLLWKPENPATVADPGSFRAPSWSWARWDGATMPTSAVCPNLDEESDMIEYVAHEIALGTTNRYGGVTSAVLRLRASIIEIQLLESNAQEDRDLMDWKYDMRLPNDEELVGVVSPDRIDDQCKGQYEGLYAMQVKVQKPYVGSGRYSFYTGLVLRPVGEAHTFERIGVFILDENHLDLFSATEKEPVTLV